MTVITTCPALLAAVTAETPKIQVEGDALTRLRHIALEHNRPYSPFASLVSATGGLIGHIIGRDFASSPSGRQDVTLIAMSAEQAKVAGLMPDEATYLVQALNENYTITATQTAFLLERPDYQPKIGQVDPTTKYTKYLHPQENDNA